MLTRFVVLFMKHYTIRVVGSGTAATNGGTTPNGIIATSQGFGVKASAAGTATFNNSMRVTEVIQR